jgi:hypothetical protein
LTWYCSKWRSSTDIRRPYLLNSERPCWRRNSLHVGPRRGARPRPCARRIVATVVADTRIPRPRSSPLICWLPHRGFSLARRRTRLLVSESMAGRPGGRCAPQAGGAAEGGSLGGPGTWTDVSGRRRYSLPCGW